MPRRKPSPKQGTRGTAKTRQMQRNLADHILSMTDDYTVATGAEATGLTPNDIKNLRVGNMPSLRILVALVKTLRYTPGTLIAKGAPKKLSKGASVRGAQERLIKTRIMKISQGEPPADLAKKTGLSIASIYQFRTKTANVGLHSYLAFVVAGYDADELMLGAKK
jgi:hypothetical protein